MVFETGNTSKSKGACPMTGAKDIFFLVGGINPKAVQSCSILSAPSLGPRTVHSILHYGLT